MDSSEKSLPRVISVFGSYTTRVEPDIVSLQFSAVRTAKEAKNALEEAKNASQNVQLYISRTNLQSVGISQVHLGSYYNSGSRDKYQATYRFHIILQQLDRLQEILSGVIEAGANNIQSVDFQTTRLKEVRTQARQQSIHAARDKALNYCEAANVQLGRVIRIDDQNPDRLQNNQRYQGHTPVPVPLDSGYLDGEETVQAVNPASIVVSAAVKVVFEINYP